MYTYHTILQQLDNLPAYSAYNVCTQYKPSNTLPHAAATLAQSLVWLSSPLRFIALLRPGVTFRLMPPCKRWETPELRGKHG